MVMGGFIITLKETTLKQFEYCKAIADDIIKNNRSLEVITHAKKYAEIESKLTGETDAD